MTDLEQQLADHLRRRAAEAAPRYDLEAVEGGVSHLSLVDLDGRRRRRIAFRVAAAIVILAAASGVLWGQLDDSDETTFADTTEGQPVGVPYAFFDGEVTTSAPYPWAMSFADVSALALNDNRDARVELVEDPLPVESGCEQGPAPTDAEALAQAIRSDPDLDATAPVAVTVGGIEGLSMDIALAPGGNICEPRGGPETGGDRWRTPLPPGSRMRLYLVDLPEGSATQMLAIAIVAPEARFEDVFEAAAPIIESIEFHPGGS